MIYQTMLDSIKKNITLVIPAKNESQSLPSVIKKIEKKKYKFIIILEKNDEVTFKSIIKYKRNIIIQKKSGYGFAIKAGIKKVKTKFFVIINADNSMNVNEIDNMYKKILIHNLDAVFASRYLKNSKSYDDTLVTFIGNKIFTFIGNYFYSLGISDILYTFVIAKTKIVKKINIKNNDFRFCVELPIKLKRSKAKLGEINSTEKPRLAGKKKVNALKDGFLILTELIRLFFNKKEN